MTQTDAYRLENLDRFLPRGLRIGASTMSVMELLRNEWTGGYQPCPKSLRTEQQLGVTPR
jgi:Flp pilus assembly protein TadB